MWRAALLAIVVGVVAVAAAWWFTKNFSTTATELTTAVGFASDFFGFFGVTLGLGTIGVKAWNGSGFMAMTPAQVAAPGVLTIAGALLLAA